jgi:hypothetical protein
MGVEHHLPRGLEIIHAEVESLLRKVVRGQGSGKNVEWTLPTILIIPAFHSLGVSQRPMNDCHEKFKVQG